MNNHDWYKKKEEPEESKNQYVVESRSSIEVKKNSKGYSYGIKLYKGVTGDELNFLRDTAIELIKSIEEKIEEDCK